MRRELFDLFQILVQAGAVPGEDFSFNLEDEVCGLTERGYALLQEAYPDIDWSDCVTVSEPDFEEAIAAIHSHLGVDFVDRLVVSMSLRLKQLSDLQAAWYLLHILDGVEYKTRVPLYDILLKTLPLHEQARIVRVLNQVSNAVPCGEWIVDLVLAAGGHPDDVAMEEDSALLTEQGMRLLASVWTGDQNLFEELARHAA